MLFLRRIALFIGLAVAAAAHAEMPKTNPDLTQDSKVDRELTYNLGSTGLRGWIYTRAANFRDSQEGRTTTVSRQILVTHVGANSPADGVMQVDDILLGVGGKPFSDDARKTFGAAITEAEKTENGGILKLTRWRAGAVEDVQLKLRVMGSYSATAPYNCPKSKRIFEEACKVLEKEPIKGDIWGAINCLALLSTGKPEYLPKITDYAHQIAPLAAKLELKDAVGMVIWDWGYKNLFLCEYYQTTHDAEVLPAITAYTVTMAKGQSMYGTFGHGISAPTPEGKLHGSIPPYGALNSAGLVANMSIIMGKRCGVKDPEVDDAVDRAAKFFAYFVGKGAVPYGEHMPWASHDNNGKNAMAAVMFAVLPKHSREARYYAKMVTASFHNREYGHTGQGFSYLWGALGANAGGPLAASAFFHQAAWHLDLVRRNDGSFTYDGAEQYGPGKTDDNTYYGKSSYNGLSPTASYVLTYSLALKKLWITGKDADPANILNQKSVDEAIFSGNFYEVREKKTVPELLTSLSDWSPVVRSLAAEELSKRPEAKTMIPALITMAEGPDAWKRQGAAETLGYLKTNEALPVLVRLLVHPDRWLRVKAAEALKGMGDQAKPVVTDMLKAVVTTAEPAFPVVWEDPVQLTHGQLAAALFGGLLRGSIEGIDTKLLYPAIEAIAQNADGMARGTLSNTLANQLKLEDLQALAPEILEAIEKPAPADTMFNNAIRMAAFQALAKFHFKEGIAAGVRYAKTQGGHGSESRTGEIMKYLVSYGTAAREVIPQLKELIDELNDQVKRREFPGGEINDRRVNAVKDAIKSIEAATEQPELRSVDK